MAEILNPQYIQIDLSGATESLDPSDLYNYYILYNTGSLSGNYILQATGTPTSDVRFSISKLGNIDLNGNTFTIFGNTLTQQQASSDLLIEVIYDTQSNTWQTNLQVNNLNVPSIFEGVATTNVPTSGTTTLLPNIDRKWQVFTGSQTLVGNYTITGTGSQDGQEFWIIWDSTLDLNGNTLSIFGLTIPEGDAIGGNFTVVAKYDGSSWIPKFLNSQPGLWEATGVKSVKKLGATSTASGDYNTDLGNNNTLTGDYILVAGDNNTLTGNYSTAIGSTNTVSGTNSTAIGDNNTVSTNFSAAIGVGNNATGNYSTTLGLDNTSSALGSVTLGTNNIASAKYSLATGLAAEAFRSGSKSHSSSNFGTSLFAQNSVVQCLGITTDATKTTLLLDLVGGYITIAPNSVCNCYIKVTGVHESGGAGPVGDVITFDAWCTIKNISGTTALVGTPLYMDNTGTISSTPAYQAADTGAATWALDITPDNTNDALLIEVTGEASKTIYWHATVYIDEIKYA